MTLAVETTLPKKRRLDPVAHLKLIENRSNVVFDGFLTQVQIAGDFLVAQPVTEASKDLSFAGSEG